MVPSVGHGVSNGVVPQRVPGREASRPGELNLGAGGLLQVSAAGRMNCFRQILGRRIELLFYVLDQRIREKVGVPNLYLAWRDAVC